MKSLTPRQTQVLEMIKAYISETGMPPTRAEIARQLGQPTGEIELILALRSRQVSDRA